MKKRFFLSFIALASTAVMLSSCLYMRITFSKDTPYSSASDGTNYPSTYSYKTPTYAASDSSSNLTIQNLGYGIGQRFLPSTGSPKILVIPVAFSDKSFTTTQITRLQNTFFGTADQTGWQSVSSFYKTSSYGKLSLTGSVSPTVSFDYTASVLESRYKTYSEQGKGNYTDVVLADALNTLSKNNFDLSSYDSDSDGYIDAVWMVYAATYSNDSDVFWAYTTWSSDGSTFAGKKACLYSWASIDFLVEMNYMGTSLTTNGDAHTFIHETGHMMGLDDYYSYDCNNTTNFDTPMGGVDMMDFNIGDHCAYSKYLLGWATPTLISQEYLTANGNTLILPSTTTTGTSFLIPSYKNGSLAYNGTPFDEYLVLEYYTPTGLNEADSKARYTNGLQDYTKPGVLVYHIDASVGKLIPKSSTSVSWDGYVYDKAPAYDSRKWGVNYAYYYLFSNTRSYSYYTNISDAPDHYAGRLISLMPATGSKIQGKKTGYSSNSSLFTLNTAFGSTGTYSGFTFDDGTSPGFGFKVASTDLTGCTLIFSAF